jgi:hypothetical protein
MGAPDALAQITLIGDRYGSWPEELEVGIGPAATTGNACFSCSAVTALTFPFRHRSPKHRAEESTTKSPPRDIQAPCRRENGNECLCPQKDRAQRQESAGNSGEIRQRKEMIFISISTS